MIQVRLSQLAERMLTETRTGRNVQHELVALLRQLMYSRLAGYEDTNDAEWAGPGPSDAGDRQPPGQREAGSQHQ